MKTMSLTLVGIIALALGLIGLVVPIIPGVLFLLVAALCFGVLSRPVRSRLERNGRMKRLFGRLDAGRHLGVPTRMKLAFWAVLEAANPGSR